jgi:hypothetical protein
MRKEKWYLIASYTFLTVTFFVLTLFEHVYMDALLSSDDASELVLSNLLSQSGGILSRDWYYSTEIRVLNAQIIWSLLFRVCGSWHLVHLLGNIICYVLLLASLYYLCRKLELKKAFPILGAIALIPVSDQYLAFILQNVCYIPYVITICLIFAMLVSFQEQHKSPKRWLFLALCVLFSIGNGMGGARQLLTFYLPFALAVVVFFLFFSPKKKDVDLPVALYGFGAVAGAVAGYLINSRVLSRRYYFAQYDSLKYTPFSLDRVVEVLNGWINVLGYKTGGKVFSVVTIYAAAQGLTCLLLVFSTVRILRSRNSYPWAVVLFALYYAAAFVCYVLLFAMTDMDYSDRYILPVSAVSYLLIFAGFLGERREGQVSGRRELSGAVLTLLTLLLIGCGVFNYYPRMRAYTGNPRKDAVDAIVAQGYRSGYATFWNANIAVELSDGQLEMWAWTDYPEDITDVDALPEWLRKVSHDTEPEGKVCVLLSTGEAEKFSFTADIPSDHVIFVSDDYTAYGFTSVEELKTYIED